MTDELLQRAARVERELADLRADVACLIGRWGPGAAIGDRESISGLIAGLRRAVDEPGADRPDSLLNLSRKNDR